MSIDYCRFEIAMVQQSLNNSNLLLAFEQVGCELTWKARDSLLKSELSQGNFPPAGNLIFS